MTEQEDRARAEVWVSLRFVGRDGLGLDEVTDAVGRPPTKTNLKKETEAKLGAKLSKLRGDVFWSLTFVEDVNALWPSGALDEATIADATALLKSRASQIREVASRCVQASVWVSWHGSLSQGGFRLPPKFVEACAAAGLPIDVSILSWGGVETDEGRRDRFGGRDVSFAPSPGGGTALAATVDGRKWEVSVGDFPDEPLYTLRIDGREAASFDEWPARWLRPEPR